MPRQEMPDYSLLYETREDGTIAELTVHTIDAHDASKRFPKQFSLTPPTRGRIIAVQTPQSAAIRGEPPPPPNMLIAPPVGDPNPMRDQPPPSVVESGALSLSERPVAPEYDLSHEAVKTAQAKENDKASDRNVLASVDKAADGKKK